MLNSTRVVGCLNAQLLPGTTKTTCGGHREMITTPTRHRYIRPLSSLREELDRIFGEFLPTTPEAIEGSGSSAVWSPRVDFSENDKSYMLKVDLPGMRKTDITVSVDDHILTISGERKEEKKEEKEDYILLERAYGNFRRSLNLPKSAEVNKVKAEFANGVLSVEVPKSEERKARLVAVN